MHGNTHQLRDYIHELDMACWQLPASIQPVLALPFPYLPIAAAARDYNSRLKLAAQDVSAHKPGAFTGEVASEMLADIGVDYAIIGHSERRRYHHETDALVAQKAERLSDANLAAIVCVGETLEEYTAEATEAVLKRQIYAVLGHMNARSIVAYEPVWAIGSGKTPSANEIEAAACFLHTQVKEALDPSPTVVYGGSVNRSNAPEILAVRGVAGALIGGACLNVDDMTTILKSAENVALKG